MSHKVAPAPPVLEVNAGLTGRTPAPPGCCGQHDEARHDGAVHEPNPRTTNAAARSAETPLSWGRVATGSPVAAVMVALALVASACSASSTVPAADSDPTVPAAESDPAGPAADSDPSPTALAPPAGGYGLWPGGESPLLDLLGWVPDGPISYMTLTDFDAVARATDTPRPVDCSTDEQREAYRDDLLRAGQLLDLQPPKLVFDSMRDPAALAASFGIEICEIAASIEPGQPGDVLMVVDGSSEAIDRAVLGDPIWSELVRVDEFAGLSFYDWGDGINLEAGPSPARPVAEGGQLATIERDGSEQLVIRTRDHVRMQNYLSAQGASLLERPSIRDAVERLAAFDPYTIVLTEDSYGADPAGALGTDLSDDVRAQLEDELGELDGGLVPWQLLGLGGALDEAGDPLLVVFMVHTSPDDAAENAARLAATIQTADSFRVNAPWSDQLSLDNISVDGTYLTATLRGVNDRGPLQVAIQSLLARDTLFMVQG